jgi:uncharacterized protein (DUF2336 family)
MTEHQRLIEDLDRTLSSQNIGSRAEALRRVTDLFLSAPTTYSEPEIAVFDDVMLRLVQDIESSLRAALAARVARIPNAPKNLMRVLASDQAIEVAGPVLRSSERLDDPTLAATARTCSQQHLLAISQRATISEIVTDVLVERGDRVVALSTVNNAGARFSATGHAILVERSKSDDELATGVWSRTDIPHHQLLKLLSIASERVRRTLEAADPRKTQFIHDMMVAAANEMQDRMRAKSPDYVEEERRVAALHRAGELDDAKVLAFARAGQFDATTIALSILCDLPIGACERAMVQERPELVLMLAKAIRLSWDTAKAILRLRAGAKGISPSELERGLSSYSRLNPDTAIKALHFLRLRERATNFNPGSAAYH